MLLEVQNLSVSYGAVRAVRDLSFGVEKGELLALIGPNGAGKSTTLRAITGLTPLEKGTISFKDKRISGKPTYAIARGGVALAPEGRQIFGRLTVFENLRLPMYARSDKAGFKPDLEKVYDLFPVLRDRQGQVGGTLSGGEQQMLCIGRALMAKPQLLLMDEPSLGLAPILVRTIFNAIRQLHGEGITILLVEQNARMALQVADRAIVLEAGRAVLEDTGQNCLRNPDIKKHYLGEQAPC